MLTTSIGLWDVSNVKRMWSTFAYAENFNQDISSWDVSNVENMNYMFFEATSFSKHNLNSWDVSNVTEHIQFGKDWGTGNTEPSWSE